MVRTDGVAIFSTAGVEAAAALAASREAGAVKSALQAAFSTFAA
jgi:hypothetical protein